MGSSCQVKRKMRDIDDSSGLRLILAGCREGRFEIGWKLKDSDRWNDDSGSK